MCWFIISASLLLTYSTVKIMAKVRFLLKSYELLLWTSFLLTAVPNPTLLNKPETKEHVLNAEPEGSVSVWLIQLLSPPSLQWKILILAVFCTLYKSSSVATCSNRMLYCIWSRRPVLDLANTEVAFSNLNVKNNNSQRLLNRSVQWFSTVQPTLIRKN